MTGDGDRDRDTGVRTVLLTAFAPFDGQAVNASALAVAEVERRWSGPARLVTAVLPVSFRTARQELRRLVAEHGPDVVVATGEAGGRGAVGLERVALNLIDARIPDVDGSAPVDVPVIAGRPTAHLTGLPVKAMLAAIRATGIPAEVSTTAGTYVCNATFYALMDLAERRPGLRAGFVHVPRTPEQVDPAAPALPTEETAVALLTAVRTAVEVVEDVRVAAGTEA